VTRILDLFSIFESLARPTVPAGGAGYFSAHLIPGFENHRLGKDGDGAPAVLISVRDFATRARPSPIVLENLTVHHDVHCRIKRGDEPLEEGRFTVLRCTGEDTAIHLHFLRIASPLVMLVGVNPTRTEVSLLIDSLVELFRVINEAPRKSVQGLWAEVFLISGANSPEDLVDAWHVVPQDRYDFNAGSFRIEVKSATGRSRHHYFSLEQLYPPMGSKLIVASVFVERTGGGTSLGDLVNMTRERLAGNVRLVAYIDRIVFQSLGSGWRRALDERFDLELAKESLAFFDPSQVPRLSQEVPVGISEVRFRSDFSGRLPIETQELESEGGLFRAALRK
jgi:hypothetical protein